MKRREVIKLVTLSAGAALSIPLVSALVTGCTTKENKKNTTDYQLVFFEEGDYLLVQHLLDIILPKSDSPSATEIGVDQIIDTIVGKTYTAEDKELYLNNFKDLQKYLNEQGDFLKADELSKIQLLDELSRSKEESLANAKLAFIDLKQQGVSYYLSSEEIAIKYLNYLPVPGKYEPCISVEQVDNIAWAL